jgi:hypothetical protein
MPTPRCSHRSAARAGLVLALVLLAACGAPSDDPPTGGTGPVSTTIDRTGGTLEARSDDGTRLRLTIAPNATAEPIQITITPLPANASIARFELQPYGLRLRLPIEYRLTLPEPAPDSTTLLLAQGDTRVPAHTQLSTDRRTLTATTPQLGYPTTSLDTARLQPFDDDPPTSGPIEADPVACAQAITHLNETRKPNREGWLLTVAEAEALLQARLTALQACTTPNDLAALNAETELLQEAACSRLLGATVDALALYTPALGANIDDLWTYTEALLVHAATIDLTGGACPQRADLEDTLDTITHRYADAYPTRIANLDTDFWRLIWSTEMRNLDKLLSAARYFDLPTTTQDRLRHLAGDLLDALHPRAYERCRDENTQGYLADLLNGGGHLGRPIWPVPDEYRGTITAADLKRDIQHCATTLTITPFDELAEPIPGEARTLGARTPPNPPLTEHTLQLPTGGALQLTGELRPLRCEAYRQPPRFSNDTIALYLDGTEVARWTHTNANYLTPTRDLALSELLEAAGLPEDATGIFTLTLRRQGEACNGDYGDTDTLLYEIDLVIGAANSSVSVVSRVLQSRLDARASGNGSSCTSGDAFPVRTGDLSSTALTGLAVETLMDEDVTAVRGAGDGTCRSVLDVGIRVESPALVVDDDEDEPSVTTTFDARYGFGLASEVTGAATSMTTISLEMFAQFIVDVTGEVEYVLTYAGYAAGDFGGTAGVELALTRQSSGIFDVLVPRSESVNGVATGTLAPGRYVLSARAYANAAAYASSLEDDPTSVIYPNPTRTDAGFFTMTLVLEAPLRSDDE